MIKINCTTQDTLPLDALTEFQGELKKRDDSDYEKISRSIKKHGFLFPFFTWKHGKKNYVIDGHGRLGALQRMVAMGEKIPPLPVVYVNCKNETEAKEALLKLNSQYGHMTAESVREFLGDLQIDFSDLALPDGTLDLSLNEEKETKGDDNEIEPELEKPADSKPGEVYQLGPHRLICGDSTKYEDVAKLMGDEKADMVVTDPPYNVDYTGGMQIKNGKIESNGKKKIKNDKANYDTFYRFLFAVFQNIKRFTRTKSGLYIFYAHSQSRAFLNAFYDAGLKQRSIIIWHKTSGGFGDFMAQYMNAYEPCIYGINNDKEKDESEAYRPLIYGSNGDTVRWYGPLNEKTVWDVDKEKKCNLHPTMKPVALISRAIKNSSKEGDIVFDAFGGSGTTLIAAAKLGRKARLCELDPHYCDVIRRRWTTWAMENGKEIGSGGLK